jgi:hypothetical protein
MIPAKNPPLKPAELAALQSDIGAIRQRLNRLEKAASQPRGDHHYLSVKAALNDVQSSLEMALDNLEDNSDEMLEELLR